MISPEKIAEMLAAAEKATPGPWGTDDPHIVFSATGGAVVYLAGTRGLDTAYPQAVADATHIANCDPATITEILSELLTLRAERDEATRQWRNYEAAAADTLTRALAAEAQLARQGEVLHVQLDHHAHALEVLLGEAADMIDAALSASPSPPKAEEVSVEALVEQAFRDGLTYATNCVVTDPDEAWRTSRARASIKREA